MTRIAVPSKGRLRDSVISLLRSAGYRIGSGRRASGVVESIEFIEMRPRDAAAWLKAGRLDAAFISTDTALENEVDDWPTVELGFSRSDLVVACRNDAPYVGAKDLEGKTVATHLPNWTGRWFAEQNIDVRIVAMGGSLEGICARGLADAIVDLRETGGSLARNSLHAIEVVEACQAVFTTARSEDIDSKAKEAVDDLVLRIGAVREAERTQYVMLHVPADQVDQVAALFPGLEAPTVLPLTGRSDLVAVHIVVQRSDLWARLSDLRSLGASGIVALQPAAIVE